MRLPSRRFGLLTTLFLVLVLLAAWLIIATPAGVKLGTYLAMRQEARLRIEGAEGNFWDGVNLGVLEWEDQQLQVRIAGVRARWRAACLVRRRACLDRIRIESLAVRLPAQTAADNTQGNALPEVVLPIEVRVDRLSIDSIQVRTGDQAPLEISNLHLRARWDGALLSVQKLTGQYEKITARLSGQLEMRANYPLHTELEVDWDDSDHLQIAATGNLRQTELKMQLEGRYSAQATVSLEPLTEQLPMRGLVETGSTIAVPVGQHEKLQVDTVRAAFEGSLQQLNATIEVDELGTPWATAGKARFDLVWRPGTFVLEDSMLHSGEGLLRAQGSVDLNDERHWQLLLEPVRLPLKTDRLAGTVELGGTIRAGGQWPESGLVGEAALALRVGYASNKVLVEGSVFYSPQTIETKSLSLTDDLNRVWLDGRLSPTLELQARLDVADLGRLLAGTRGTLEGEVLVSGTSQWPRLSGHLEAHDLGTQGWQLGELQLAAHDEDLAIQARDLHLGSTKIGALNGTLQGNKSAHQLRLEANDEVFGEIEVACDGNLTESTDWLASCAEIAWRPAQFTNDAAWKTEDPVGLHWRAKEGLLEITAFCLGDGVARLCNRQSLSLSRKAVDGVDLGFVALPIGKWLALIPAAPRVTGELHGELAGNWTAGGPLSLAGSIEIPVLGITVERDAGDFSLPDLLDFKAALTLQDERLTSELAADGANGFSIRGELSIDDLTGSRRLGGVVNVNQFDIGPLGPFDPQITALTGMLDGNVRLAGTLAAPEFSGAVDIRNGKLEHEMLPRPIDAFSARLSFEGNKATITAELATAGGGGELSGQIDWTDAEAWNAYLKTNLEGLTLEPLPGSRIELSPNVTVALSPSLIDISGSMAIPSALLILEELPRGTENISRDTVIVGADTGDRTTRDYRLGVDITLGDQVRLSGYGADARLTGSLRIRGDHLNPLSGDGEIRIAEGTYRAYGQRLNVTSGSLLFQGALDNPDIRLVALRELDVEDVQVGIRASGPARNPTLELFSQPPMPDGEAAHYLVTGRAPDASNGDTNPAVDNVLIGLGAAGAQRGLADAFSSFGIEDFRISTGAGQTGDTEVQLSGYITPDLYLRYGMGIYERVNTLRLRYRLRSKLFLEVISGLDTAVDLIYSFQR